MVSGFIHLVWKVTWNAIVVLVCASLIFIGYKANQPMAVDGAPKGMTYMEFIQDRLDAAKAVQPSRCGWGMMLSLAAIGPIYSVIYTTVAIHPDGFLAKVTAPDSDIPKGVASAKWYEVPGIWWNTVERLSWTMVGKPAAYGCKFRPVQKTNFIRE
ncbi:MAG: hypothetical protein NTZ74_07505 [Chloroflexi bacterium]|nr:hypothetical protein [Chloroflexota bacterium]